MIKLVDQVRDNEDVEVGMQSNLKFKRIHI